jgi:hypothetical protein
MDTDFTETEIRDLENSAYQAGIALGESIERKRIIAMLLDGWCNDDSPMIAAIKGDDF